MKSNPARPPAAFIGALLLTGIFAGAIYLPLSLQLMLGASRLNQLSQSITIFFFPLCWAAMGLGFLAPPLKSTSRIPQALWVIIFGLMSLFLPIQVDSNLVMLMRLGGCLIPAGLIYLWLGRELNLRFSQYPHVVFNLYAFFMLGMAAGYFFADVAVPYLGGNGILLFFAIGLLSSHLGARVSILAALAAALIIHYTGADFQIERRRNVGSYGADFENNVRSGQIPSIAFFGNYPNAFPEVRWNRRGQTFYVPNTQTGQYHWTLNLDIEHSLPIKLVDGKNRRFFHGMIKPDQQALLIGAGAGRSLSGISDRGKNIYSVERDNNTVDILRERKFNPFIFDVNYIAGDGRAYLEQSRKKWDWIIVESALDPSDAGPFQPFMPQSLYTPNAIKHYLSSLEDGGILVMEVHRFTIERRKTVVRTLVGNVEKLAGEGFQTLFFRTFEEEGGSPAHFWVAVLKGEGDLSKIISKSNYRTKIIERMGIPECAASFSDDAPFLGWMCMKEETKRQFLTLSLAILAVFFTLTVSMRKGKFPNALKSVFLLQSAAQCFLFLGISYKLRSIFLDELVTFYVFSFATTLIAAGASFYKQYLFDHEKSMPLRYVSGGLVLSIPWLFLFLSLDPLFEGPLLIRAALFLVAVTPAYFFSSMLFNVTLAAAARHEGIREAFLYESIAIIPAYAVLPWVLFELGISYLIGAALIAFAISFGLLYRFRRQARS